MKRKGSATLTTLALGCMLLSVTSGPAQAQGASPSTLPARQAGASPAAASKATPTDDFAGLKLTDDQRARMEQIRATMKARKDAVLQDHKLMAEQRTAMLQGFQRMENGEIYSKVLTREQQAEVRKKVLARRAAAQQAEMKKLQGSKPQ